MVFGWGVCGEGVTVMAASLFCLVYISGFIEGVLLVLYLLVLASERTA